MSVASDQVIAHKCQSAYHYMCHQTVYSGFGALWSNFHGANIK